MDASETNHKLKKTIITGIPRSGTSLLTKLLSIQQQTICFSEPEWLKTIRFTGQSCREFSSSLNGKLNEIYSDISIGKEIELTVKRGTQELPDNYFNRNQSGYDNVKETKRQKFKFSKELRICVKSNTLFTACLQALKKCDEFNLVAVVRDPVSVLMSWRSLDIPVSRGQVKIAELYSQEIRDLANEQDLLVKQIKIMDWFFKQYQKHQVKVVKYEDIIADQKNTLTSITRVNHPNTLGLESKNQNTHYDLSEHESIQQAIIKHGHHYQNHYNY